MKVDYSRFCGEGYMGSIYWQLGKEKRELSQLLL
jgi:hypothetical protein